MGIGQHALVVPHAASSRPESAGQWCVAAATVALIMMATGQTHEGGDDGDDGASERDGLSEDG
jgi:hypothetical protein